MVLHVREKVVERPTKGHRMDRHDSVIGQFEHNHFQEVPGCVRPNEKYLRRVGVRVEVHHDERMAGRVRDVPI